MLYPITGRRLSALSLMVLFMAAPLGLARAETLDQLYEKAKAEGALTIYTGAGPAAARANGDAFEKRFPGIKVTANGGFSNVLNADIDQQIKDKKITADYVQFQTIGDYPRWDKMGVLLHWKPEGFDQVLPAMKDKDGAWVALNFNPLVYGYNPDKVAEADVPKSALDFLNPKFKGQAVTAYPADDDATLYDFVLIERKYGMDYMKKYLANGGFFVQGHRDVALRVRTGDKPLSFDMTNGSQTNGPDGKLKIVMSAKDKTPVFFTAGGIFKQAPHPNAAKLYLSWQLSKEVQGKNPIIYSPRVDVATPPGMPPITSPRFANDYAGFTRDAEKIEALRRRYGAMTGPVVNKSTVQ